MDPTVIAPGSIEIRHATENEQLPVRRLIDGALLVLEDLPDRIDAGDVLVAVPGDDSGTILGVVVLDPHSEDHARIDAIAVRHARRSQGIGSALIEYASEQYPRLTAEFDPSVRPFYDALAFDIEPADADDRLRGTFQRKGDKPTDQHAGTELGGDESE